MYPFGVFGVHLIQYTHTYISKSKLEDLLHLLRNKHQYESIKGETTGCIWWITKSHKKEKKKNLRRLGCCCCCCCWSQKEYTLLLSSRFGVVPGVRGFGIYLVLGAGAHVPLGGQQRPTTHSNGQRASPPPKASFFSSPCTLPPRISEIGSSKANPESNGQQQILPSPDKPTTITIQQQ
jgi:hypothetical protein